METTWNFHRYAALLRHWGSEGPPVYISAAAYLGVRKSKPERSDLLGDQDLANFLSAFPGGERAPTRS